MKVKQTLLFSLLLFLNTAFSQSAFYDALTLAKTVETQGDSVKLDLSNSTVQSILKRYIPDLPNNPTAAQIKAAFEKANNPFIHPSDQNTAISLVSGNSEMSSLGANTETPKIADASISKIADGLAQFLVERFKEEMNIHFIRRFKVFLSSYPEAQVLFPQSFAVLQNIESYQYASILQVLKETFEKDVELLAIHLPELRNLRAANCQPCADKLKGKAKGRCAERVKNCKQRMEKLEAFFKTEKGTLLMAALISVKELQDGTSPALIFDKLANDQSIDNLPSNLSNALKLGNKFSKSLLNESGNWVSSAEVKSFLKNKHAVLLFLGLLYQEAGDLNYPLKSQTDSNPKVVKFRSILQKLKPNTNLAIEFIRDFNAISSELNVHFASLKAAIENKRSLNFFDYYKIFTALGDLVETSLNTQKLFALVQPNFQFPPEIKLALDSIYRPTLNIAYDLAEKNYSTAIYDIVDLLATVGLDSEGDFVNDLKKYGLFVAQVASAENSSQVKEAIEAVALPVGSARIKRETKSNIAIQAYLGGFFGGEIMPELSNIDSTQQGAFIAAVHAPVGVAFSRGTKNGCSWSLFISAIDIGAITAYRFNDDQTEALPDFTLQNILAPGAYLIYGFRNSPVSLGIGGQMGPAVRKLSKTENGVDLELNNRINWRVGASILVDIPLFNISTKPR